jgi:hypothetical protein
MDEDAQTQVWDRVRLPAPPPVPAIETPLREAEATQSSTLPPTDDRLASTLPPLDDRPTQHDPSCVPVESRTPFHRRLAAWFRARFTSAYPPPPPHPTALDEALWCATSEDLAAVAQLAQHIRAIREMGADETEAQLVHVLLAYVTSDAYGAVAVADVHQRLRSLTPAAIDGALARLSAVGRIDLFPDGRGGQRCRLRPERGGRR